MSERECPGHGPGGEAGTTFFGDPGRCPDCLRAEVADLTAQVEKLQRFKGWVHSYLDAHGVPHHPPGTHGAEGCRVGDRMDWLMAQLAEADERAAANGARAAELQAEVEWLRKETVPRNAHDLLSAGMGRSEELRSELKRRCRELEALLKPFADKYAARLAENPQAAVYPGDSFTIMPGVPLGAWRAAHRALNPLRCAACCGEGGSGPGHRPRVPLARCRQNNRDIEPCARGP